MAISSSKMVALAAVAAVVLALTTQTDGACVCGFGPGKDMCSDGRTTGSCTPMVVRPAPVPKIDFITGSKPRVVCKEIISGFRPLKPVGDLCSCRQTIVSPALVPRPACRKCQYTSSSSSSSGSNSNSHNSNSHHQQTIYDAVPAVYEASPVAVASYPSAQSGGAPAVAADPISLSLIYSAAQKQCGASEDRLAYGFRSVPKDIPILKVKKIVRDEDTLHQMRGPVIEMRPVSCSRAEQSVDDAALEELIDEEINDANDEAAYAEPSSIRQLTYEDIGFAPAKVQTQQFIAVQGDGDSGASSASETFDTSPVSTCNDGFQPGGLIVRSVPQREVYHTAPALPVPCPDDDERDDVFYPAPYPLFGGSRTVSSSSNSHSSQSNSHANQHHVVFETLAPCDS